MQQIPPDKSSVIQSNLTFWLARFSASGRKDNFCLCDRKNPAVGNGNLMGVTSKVFNGISETIEGLLNVRAPVLFIKAVFPLLPVIMVTQLFAGRRKNKGIAFIKRGKMRHIFALELITKNVCTDKKVIGGFPDFSVLRKSAAGNNTVHMYVMIQFLIPCVKHLYDTGCCAEPLSVGGQFQKCFGAASVEQSVQKLLVAVNEWI